MRVLNLSRKLQTKASIGAMSRRSEGWPNRLNRLVNEYQGRSFEYGVTDCGTLACDVVNALIGIDLYQEFKNTYNDKKSYLLILAKYSVRSIADLFDIKAREHDILESKNPIVAFRGDIVCISYGEDCLGVCVGARAVCLPESGLLSVPMADVTRSWRVD